MQKQNCWEFNRCGRELGGRNVFRDGVCPASTDIRFDGIHDGICGGRTCWVIAGTMCSGKTAGTYAMKKESCRKCKFFNAVWEEEGDEFQPTIDLMRLLHAPPPLSINLQTPCPYTMDPVTDCPTLKSRDKRRRCPFNLEPVHTLCGASVQPVH